MTVTGAPHAARDPGRPPRIPRLITGSAPVSLAEHLDRYGPPPLRADRPAAGRTVTGLIDEIDRAGLTGRGGAGFPAARKMRAVADAASRGGTFSSVGAVVIANGAESEPASWKDRLLLSRAPHLVLDGVALAAEAVGASRAYLCVHAGPVGPAAGPLRDAIASRDRAGLNRVPVQLAEIPGGYVTSQETALVGFLNGGPARPAFVPPRPAQRGAHRRPTLVQNVETLAHAALIARYGADWFRAAGTAAFPGTALMSVGGAVRRPGVYEAALGTTLASLLQRAGGPAEAPAAVLAGGYFGGWLPLPAAQHIPLSDEALRPAGASLGPGVLVLLPESSCGLAETARAVRYLASQSAGQCGPCSNGLPALAEAMEWIAYGRAGAADGLSWAQQLLRLVSGRGACHLPDGTASMAASALRVFGADLLRHLTRGPCQRVSRAGVLPVPRPPAGAS